jgi:hypothetical protein
LIGNTTAKNAASGFRKAGLYPCNSNLFRPHEFLAAEKDLEKGPFETLEVPQPGTSRDRVNISPVADIDISSLLKFREKCQKKPVVE